MKSFNQFLAEADDDENPKVGTVLAKHTDKHGYSAVITHGVPKKYGKGDLYLPPRGMMHIQHPNGKTRPQGFWMDWPEKEWKLKDHEYNAKPIRERAVLEAKHQATNYGDLKDRWHELEHTNKHRGWK